MDHKKKEFSIKEAFLNGFTQFLVFIGAIVFFFVIYKFNDILGIIGRLCSILMPILIGIVMAYLLHPIVEFMEKKLYQVWTEVKKKISKKTSSHNPDENLFTSDSKESSREGFKEGKKNYMRIPAIFLTLILVIGVLYFLANLVVPELYRNITKIIYAVPAQTTRMYRQLEGMISENTQLAEFVDNAYIEVMEFVTGWMKKDMLDQVSKLLTGVFGVVGALSDFIIGIIVAIYVLLSKETFSRQFNLVLRAFFSDHVSAKVKEILRESDRIFGGFISGKIIDSLIIGVLCFIGAIVLKLPYAVLISVIVGVTNIIPFFGPYIGAIPSTILIFLDSPTKGLIFLVFVVLLQQFDGNILGPKILGESTGLSPFWVIFAILLGSGLFGILGMIVGVPAFGVIYYLIKSYIHYRLQKKNEENSL